MKINMSAASTSGSYKATYVFLFSNTSKWCKGGGPLCSPMHKLSKLANEHCGAVACVLVS